MLENNFNFDFNKLILHPEFESTLNEIKKINMALPEVTSGMQIDNDFYDYQKNNFSFSKIEEIDKTILDPSNGYKFLNDGRTLFSYDESIDKYESLEGVALSTTHSLIMMDKNEYIPAIYLTFYFYTRSKEINEKSHYIKFCEKPEELIKIDYIKDKINFLMNTVPDNAILLLDGPLIAGDVYTYFIKPIIEMTNRKIIPLFFVKNSLSNMVINNYSELKNKYNSDMHWAYRLLENGERTALYKYIDKNNPRNAKVFCYLKFANNSPQRVEMHLESYNMNKHLFSSLMDMIYFLLVAQGDTINPQIRTIAIAEKYARSALKMVNINEKLKIIGITPTMNQKRFG